MSCSNESVCGCIRVLYGSSSLELGALAHSEPLIVVQLEAPLPVLLGCLVVLEGLCFLQGHSLSLARVQALASLLYLEVDLCCYWGSVVLSPHFLAAGRPSLIGGPSQGGGPSLGGGPTFGGGGFANAAAK